MATQAEVTAALVRHPFAFQVRDGVGTLLATRDLGPSPHEACIVILGLAEWEHPAIYGEPIVLRKPTVTDDD